MNFPCWDVVGWPKRGIAHEPPSVETFSMPNTDLDHAMIDIQSSSPLLRLPGELRTRMFELCISDARFCPRCLKHHEIVADVSLNMQIRGIGPLPMLFTNKQIHNELVSLVYSRLEPVAINGYFLIFQPRPTSFLPHSYPAIWPRHPHVQTFARKVTITMAYWKTWGEGQGSWCDFTSDRQASEYSTGNAINPDTLFETNRSIIRKLAKHLRTFKSLCKIEIIIELRWETGDEDESYGLQQLLPLYDLRLPNTTARFDIICKAAMIRHSNLIFPAEYQDRSKLIARTWMQAWGKLLADTERQIPKSETIVQGPGNRDLHFIATCVTKF